jgi:ribonuclease R
MDFLKCEFMSHRIGETFTGRIANITNFGFFVTLDDIYIDGLVHVSALTNDYYHYSAETFTLNGERSGTRFALMDAVEIQVAKVDIEERKIDFELLAHKGKWLAENGKDKKPAKKAAKAIAGKAAKAADKKTVKTAGKKSADIPPTKAEKREQSAQKKTAKTAAPKKAAKSGKPKATKAKKTAAATTATKSRKTKKS